MADISAWLSSWFFPVVMPFVLGYLIWLAFAGKWTVINRANHPAVFWTAIVVWGLSFVNFVWLDLAVIVRQALRIVNHNGG